MAKKKNPRKVSVGFLFDDTLDSSDGVAQYVRTLGAWMSAQGHSVSYLVGQTKMDQWAGGKVYSLSRNQKVVFNGNRLRVPMPANASNVKRVLAENNFDVLHVQVPYSPFMAGRVIKNADRSVAVVGTFHIYPAAVLVEVGTRFLRFLSAKSLKRFDQIVSVSPPAAEFALKTFGTKTAVIPNAVDLSKFANAKSKVRKTEHVKKIVFLGRLVDRKGCLYLLRAFVKLKEDSNIAAKLIIGGDGPQRSKLEGFVRHHNLSDYVDFLGFIDESDKAQLLAEADIACFPSLYGESFGIVLIEAMAAGAGVVIGGDNPGYRSTLANQDEVLFNPKNTDTFAARLKELLENDGLTQNLHKWQQAEVKKYDVSLVGKQLIDVYARAIATKSKKRHN